MNGWAWAGLLGGGALLALMWNEFANTPDDVSWTDPSQPPPMLALDLGAVGARPCRPYCRTYPASLAAWDGTVVGDC